MATAALSCHCHSSTINMPCYFYEQHSENQWQKSNKWQSSSQVESDSTWHDDCQILIQPFLAAADQSENSNYEGGRLLSCQEKSLSLFAVCLFFLSFEGFEKLGLMPKKKWRQPLGQIPYPLPSCQRSGNFQAPPHPCFHTRVLYPMPLHFSWISRYIKIDFEEANPWACSHRQCAAHLTNTSTWS